MKMQIIQSDLNNKDILTTDEFKTLEAEEGNKKLEETFKKEGAVWIFPTLDRAGSESDIERTVSNVLAHNKTILNKKPRITWSIYYGDVPLPKTINVAGFIDEFDNNLIDEFLKNSCAINIKDNNSKNKNTLEGTGYKFRSSDSPDRLVELLKFHKENETKDLSQIIKEAMARKTA